MDLRIGFLASHRGSNVKAIVTQIERGNLRADPSVVISNNLNAEVLQFARDKEIPQYCFNSLRCPLKFNSVDDAILNAFHDHGVNLIVLAGYNRPVSRILLEAFPKRVLNIHPALLPKYCGKGMYGLSVHEAVIAADDKESGATVHLVTEEYDSGPVVAQVRVPRYARDTAQTLAERVLEFEHVLYPRVLKDIQTEIIDLDSLV